MANDSGNSSVVFICHEGSRTGAPLILLEFLKWLKKNTGLPFRIIIRKSGELDDQFRSIAPVLVLHGSLPSFFLLKWLSRAISAFTQKKKISGFIDQPVSLIYSNTISNGVIAAWLKKKYQARLITHVHELGGVIDSLGIKNLDFVRQTTDHYIAASNAVKNNLVAKYKIPEPDISVVYEFMISFTGNPVMASSVLKMINDNHKIFIVGSVGFTDYRKGFDLFLDTARIVINELDRKEIFFIWIGDFGKGKKELAGKFIETNRLSGHVFFTGPVDNPSEYYTIFDLVFLPSREDPFPLAMIESGWHGRPVMCFRNSGGMNEFVDDTTGILVDDFDTRDAAAQIVEALNNKDRILKLGKCAKARVEESYTIEKKAPELLAIIKDNLI